MSFTTPESSLQEMLDIARKYGYDGYLSGEYIDAWPVDVVLPHDIEVLKSYL